MDTLYTRCLYVVTYSLLLTWSPVRYSAAASDNKRIYVNGDIILGALFPVHHKSEVESEKCGLIWEQYGIQRIEAFLLVLEEINNNTHLLPNVTLGCDIRDSCWYTPKALEESKDFIRSSFFAAQGLACNGVNATKPIAGVIGPGSSSVTEDVQNMLAQFQIPEIGYSATSMTLSNTELYPYFLRVVSPDSQQARALADLVQEFGWKYISTIHSEGTYGSKGIQQFKKDINDMGICAAADAMISSSPTEKSLDNIIDELVEHSAATVVVCFCDGNDVRRLLEALGRRGLHNNFTVIGSDGWNTRPDVVKDLESIARGSLSIQLSSPPYESFEEHYLSLNPRTHTVNPWFRELWEYKFNCNFNKSASRPTCTGFEDLSLNFTVDGKIGFVADAIYTAAYGLHNMINHYCPNKTLCAALRPLNGTLFYEYMLNVNFTTYSKKQLYFDKNGDPPGKYQVMNYQKFKNGSYGYVQIATWETGNLVVNGSIQWRENTKPVSLCSEECARGYAKRQQTEGSRCCWICDECAQNDIITSDQKCMACPKGWWPNGNLTECKELPKQHIEWTDVDALLPFICALVGITAAMGTVVVVAKNNSTAIVKASTRELSYVILIGIILAYISTIAFVVKPTIFTCYITRILPGLSFSMIYGSVLTKTNRIARILARGKKKIITKKPRCMTTTSLVLVTFLLISIELVIIIAILIWQPAEVWVTYPSIDIARLECKVTMYGIMGPFGVVFILIGLCTFYAVNTRNVPANFNEAKFIGFCMYVTCVIWIAFVPLYFGSSSKVITITMCISLSATVALMLLFWPKVYVILWHPEKNHRAEFTTTTEVRCHVGQRANTNNTSSKRYSYGLTKSSKRNTDIDIGYGSDVITMCEEMSPCDKPTADFGFYCCKALGKRSVSCQVDFEIVERTVQRAFDISSEESCMSHGWTQAKGDECSLVKPPCYKLVPANSSHPSRSRPTSQGSHRRSASLKQYPPPQKIRLCRNMSDSFNMTKNSINSDYLRHQLNTGSSSSRNLDSYCYVNNMSSSATEETQLMTSASMLDHDSASIAPDAPKLAELPLIGSANDSSAVESALIINTSQHIDRRKLYPSCESSLKRDKKNGYVNDADTANNVNRYHINSSGDSLPKEGNFPLSTASSIEDMLVSRDNELSCSSTE